MRTTFVHLGIVAICGAIAGCGGDDDDDRVRIYSSPYENVDWSSDLRLTSQHHDHIGTRADAILAYDAAGYDVVSLMDYSGNAELPHALRQRLWPVDQWVSRALSSQLKSIKLFLPNAEEVGIGPKPPGDPARHATSPFLKSYIEGPRRPLDASVELPLQPNQYRDLEQLFALIRSQGGFPCLAHPFDYSFRLLDLGDSYCLEIHNAQLAAWREKGLPAFSGVDRNLQIVETWDDVLGRNQRVFAIAVNDHFGPQLPQGVVSERVRDSGKILVLAKDTTLEAYQAAFLAGSFFAVRDFGTVKNQYPVIHSIDVDETFIYIETVGRVKWVSQNDVVGEGPYLSFDRLKYGARYVRAEISQDDGSIVYTQAFAVRPVGDADGDYDIDSADSEMCRAIADGASAEAAQRRACVRRTR
jgi:hypothetical protein